MIPLVRNAPQLHLSWSRIRRRLALHDTRLIRVALLALVIVGAGLRFYGLGSQSLWRDEAISWQFATQPTPAAMIEIVARNDLHPPLWYLLLYSVVHLFGGSEVALRLISAVSGVALIVAGYALARELFGRLVGLLSAVIFGLSPFLLRYSQEARSYSFLALLTCLTLLALVTWQAQPSARRLLTYGGLMAAMLYTHNWSFLVWAAINAYVLGLMLVDRTVRQRLRAWIGVNVFIGALYFPWLPIFLRSLGRSTAWVQTEETPLELLLQTLQAWTAGWRAMPFYVLLLALGTLSAAQLSWRRPFVRGHPATRYTLLLITTGGLPLALALIATTQKPLYKPDRYTIVVYPMFAILLALGLAALRRRGLILLATLLLVALWGRKDLGYLTGPGKSNAYQAASYVAQRQQSGDLLVFAPDPIAQSFNYYYRASGPQLGFANWTMPVPGCEGWVDAWFEPGILDRTLAQIDSYLVDGACLWLVYTPGLITVPGAEHAVEELRQSLRARYTLRYTEVFPEGFEYMDIDRYCGRAASEAGTLRRVVERN